MVNDLWMCILRQTFVFARKLWLRRISKNKLIPLPYVQNESTVTIKQIHCIYGLVKKIYEVHGITSSFEVNANETNPEEICKEIMNYVSVAIQHVNRQGTSSNHQSSMNEVGKDLEEEFRHHRRFSIHSDKENLNFMSTATAHSTRYNNNLLSAQEAYYKKIFQGRADIEVDAREIYQGLARSFTKIMSKMQIGGKELHGFKRIKDFVLNQMRTEYNFIEQSETTADHPAKKFVLMRVTNYFYNDMFNRAIFLYEKLLDELPDLKSSIFNEAYKNFSIVHFFKNIQMTSFPFMRSLYDMTIHMSHCLLTCELYNDNYGVLISRLFVAMSLLCNIN